MSTPGGIRGRRQRGNSVPRAAASRSRTHQPRLIPTGVRLTDEEYDKAHAAAANAGLSLSGYLAALIRQDELDEHGRPKWAEVANELLPDVAQPSA